MNCKSFKAYLFVLYFCIGTIAKAQQNAISSGYPDHIILNVTEDLATSIAVNWRTDSREPISKIQLAKENSSFNIGQSSKEYNALSEFLDFKEKSHYYHSIVLRDLEEETVYAYRVGNNDKWSEWINFKTLSKKAGPLKFIYFGDVQSNIKSLWSRVVRQSVRTVPDAELMLYAGDIVNRGNNLNEWEEWFAAAAPIHQSIPVMPASGNHDHADDVQGNYRISSYWNKQFNLPINGIKSLNESSYSVNVKNAKFIVLNTELFETQEDVKKEQLKWLENTLKTNKQEWIILLMHHPIFSTKKNRDNKELRSLIKPLIDKYHVDLVLQGHDHTYARGKDKIPMDNNKISNATYVVSVSGPKLSEVLAAEWMDRSLSYIQLFHSIEIDKNKLTFSAYNMISELLDRFVIMKSNGINTIID